jgi:hypothetical protein
MNIIDFNPHFIELKEFQTYDASYNLKPNRFYP